MHQKKNPEKTSKCKDTMHFRRSQGYMLMLARRVLVGRIAWCFLCSHPPSPRRWLLTSVSGRPLSKLGFALTRQRRFYVLMTANSNRGFRPVIQSCFISGRQVGRNHWAGIGKDPHHVNRAHDMIKNLQCQYRVTSLGWSRADAHQWPGSSVCCLLL